MDGIVDTVVIGGQAGPCIGRHRALPRRYRGRDTSWWMHRTGSLHRKRASLPGGPRRDPNAVLAGGVDDLDLRRLVRHGVIPHGRLTGVAGGVATFATDRPRMLPAADAQAGPVPGLDRRVVERTGLDGPPLRPGGRPPHRGPSTRPACSTWSGRDHDSSGRRASAANARFSGRRARRRGRAGPRSGVTALAGLYVVGLLWLHRRSSSFLVGVGGDAEYLADHIAARAAAPSCARVRTPA